MMILNSVKWDQIRSPAWVFQIARIARFFLLFKSSYSIVTDYLTVYCRMMILNLSSLNQIARIARFFLLFKSSYSIVTDYLTVYCRMMILNLSSLKTEQNCCRPTCRCHHLGYSVPPALHRTKAGAEAPLVPKHIRATWPRPEQSHLLPEACSPNGTDKRRQRQRQTERPPPEPSNILKRFCAL